MKKRSGCEKSLRDTNFIFSQEEAPTAAMDRAEGEEDAEEEVEEEEEVGGREVKAEQMVKVRGRNKKGERRGKDAREVERRGENTEERICKEITFIEICTMSLVSSSL